MVRGNLSHYSSIAKSRRLARYQESNAERQIKKGKLIEQADDDEVRKVYQIKHFFYCFFNLG